MKTAARNIYEWELEIYVFNYRSYAIYESRERSGAVEGA